MKTFTDYDFYKEQGGVLDEATYIQVARTSFQEIRSQTFGRDIPDEMIESVMFCEFELIEFLGTADSIDDMIPSGVRSITNDDLSVSRLNMDPGVERRNRDRTVKAICQRWLTFPVNLLYTGSDALLCGEFTSTGTPGGSSFTGNYNDLYGIPTLDGIKIKGALTKAALGIADINDIPQIDVLSNADIQAIINGMP